MSNKNNFSGSKILVVGGAGFVGSNLIHKILEEDVKQIIIVDNLLSSDISNVSEDPRVLFILGSITDDKILNNIPNDLDYAFHLACFHGNQSSIANPISDHKNNTYTSLKLFDKLKDIKHLQKIVYAAAACAVAEKTFETAVATTEDQSITLYHDSPYSISKIIGELYGNFYFQHYKLPFVKARFSNVYGPREILGAGQWRGTVHTVWRNVIPTFIWRSLNGEALPLYNGGMTSRDFIFVEDMVRGLIACAINGREGNVYNLATGHETSILELAKIINYFTSNKTPLDLLPARDWDRSGKRYASTEKSTQDLGFTASVKIQEGIRQTIEWTIENTKLIKKSIARHNKFLNQLK